MDCWKLCRSSDISTQREAYAEPAHWTTWQMVRADSPSGLPQWTWSWKLLSLTLACFASYSRCAELSYDGICQYPVTCRCLWRGSKPTGKRLPHTVLQLWHYHLGLLVGLPQLLQRSSLRLLWQPIMSAWWELGMLRDIFDIVGPGSLCAREFGQLGSHQQIHPNLLIL